MATPFLSPTLKWTLIAVAGLLIAALIFHAGVAFGERHALSRLSVREPELQGEFGMPLPHSFMPEGHGAVGTIATVTPEAITVTEREGEAEDVLLTASTTIKEGPQTLSSTDLKVGQHIVVIGMPGAKEDQIQADLIRILP